MNRAFEPKYDMLLYAFENFDRDLYLQGGEMCFRMFEYVIMRYNVF